jgi:8-oxo-dGTP diphosphatase
LDVEKPEHIDVVDSITEDENSKIRYHFVIIDYFVKLRSGALKASSDADELRWVQFDQVEEFDLTRSFRAFFQRNRQKIEAFSSCH